MAEAEKPKQSRLINTINHEKKSTNLLFGIYNVNNDNASTNCFL